MALMIPKEFGEYPDLDKRVFDAYMNKDSSALFGIIRDSVDKRILYNVLDYLEALKIRTRERWIKENDHIFSRRRKDILDDAIRILYNKNLGLRLPKDGKEIMRIPDKCLVVSWHSSCKNVEEAKARPGLPITDICRGAYHKPYETILKWFDYSLRFNRAYTRLRPCGKTCTEIITSGDMKIRYAKESINKLIDVPVPAVLESMTHDIKVYDSKWWQPQERYDFTDYWFEDIKGIHLPIAAFTIKDNNNDINYVLWAENRDEWIIIPSSRSRQGRTTLGMPIGTLTHYIPSIMDEIMGDTEEGYQAAGNFGNEILKAFGIFPGDITSVPVSAVDACATHPLKLRYLGKHKISKK